MGVEQLVPSRPGGGDINQDLSSVVRPGVFQYVISKADVSPNGPNRLPLRSKQDGSRWMHAEYTLTPC